jgi:hypothetical protein
MSRKMPCPSLAVSALFEIEAADIAIPACRVVEYPDILPGRFCSEQQGEQPVLVVVSCRGRQAQRSRCAGRSGKIDTTEFPTIFSTRQPAGEAAICVSAAAGKGAANDSKTADAMIDRKIDKDRRCILPGDGVAGFRCQK